MLAVPVVFEAVMVVRVPPLLLLARGLLIGPDILALNVLACLFETVGGRTAGKRLLDEFVSINGDADELWR